MQWLEYQREVFSIRDIGEVWFGGWVWIVHKFMLPVFQGGFVLVLVPVLQLQPKV